MSKPQTVLEALIAARELISVPERWTQLTDADDGAGHSVDVDSYEARRWCMLGAVARFAGIGTDLTSDVERALTRALPHGAKSVPMFNDQGGRRHSTILKVYDRAIAAERAR